MHIFKFKDLQIKSCILQSFIVVFYGFGGQSSSLTQLPVVFFTKPCMQLQAALHALLQIVTTGFAHVGWHVDPHCWYCSFLPVQSAVKWLLSYNIKCKLSIFLPLEHLATGMQLRWMSLTKPGLQKHPLRQIRGQILSKFVGFSQLASQEATVPHSSYCSFFPQTEHCSFALQTFGLRLFEINLIEINAEIKRLTC